MQLLTTKLHPPSLPKRILTRSRLLDVLDEAMDFKVCLLSAPTGYGKTSLVREWTEKTDVLVSWITFDEGDNELNRFLSYVAEAVFSILPKKDDRPITLLPFQGQESVELYLASLINQIANSSDALTLIVNDYEAITSNECHMALEFLIEYAPENLCVFLLSRLDPPLPFARWRARHQLLEIRTDDLRFTRPEINNFLVNLTQCDLNNDEIDIINQKTEGWAASLHLLSLSLQSPSHKDRFFKALDESLSHIIDFLAEEVLVQLPVETRSFLYKTSILSRFTGDLCHAVTREPHSDDILRDLERHNLFISHLDDDHQWYHFHPLFAECLGQRLQDDDAIKVSDLHCRAADWYANNGDADDALDHAFKAKDIDRAARIMEDYAILWIDQGDYQTFIRWFNEIPRKKISQYPSLSAFYLCALIDGRNLNEFDSYIDLQKELQDHPKVGDMIKAAQASASFLHGDHQEALQATKQNLVKFQASPPQSIEKLFAYSFNWIIQVGIYLRMNHLKEADDVFLSAIPTYLQTGLTGFAIDALGGRARNKMKMGQLHNSEEILEQGLLLLRRWGNESGAGLRSFPAAIRIFGPLSRLYYEQNRLEDSVAMAQKAIESSRSGGYVWGWRVVQVYATLGLAHLALSDKESALKALDKIKEFEEMLASYPISNMWTRQIALRQKTRLALMLAKEDASLYSQVEEWIYEYQAEDPERSEEISALWARSLIKQGKVEEASPTLHQIIKNAEAEGRNGDLIEYLLLLLSEENIHRALELAKPQGYCRIFIDGGEEVKKLLERVGTSYTNKLLEAFPERNSEQISKNESTWLNLRERQILGLLDKAYTNQEIANELHLSVNTVKWYARRIYTRLAVRNRREAVAKAKELGII